MALPFLIPVGDSSYQTKMTERERSRTPCILDQDPQYVGGSGDVASSLDIVVPKTKFEAMRNMRDAWDIFSSHFLDDTFFPFFFLE